MKYAVIILLVIVMLTMVACSPFIAVEELAEKTDTELIELLAQEDLQEIYGTDIEDFYYADAEQEYNEMLQAIADEKWEADRGRL